MRAAKSLRVIATALKSFGAAVTGAGGVGGGSEGSGAALGDVTGGGRLAPPQRQPAGHGFPHQRLRLAGGRPGTHNRNFYVISMIIERVCSKNRPGTN